MRAKQKKSNGEADESIKEELDFNRPDYTFIPKGTHLYHQEGYYLVCRSCELVHAVFIGSEKIMVGQDKEGQPILKKRIDVDMA